MKIASATKMALGNKTQKTPSAVATPLPPLKRSHTGKTWPSTARSAAQDIKRKVKTQGKATKSPQRLYFDPARRAANQTARAPLIASSASVAILNPFAPERATLDQRTIDRKSTRLNSSHTVISYAVFCLKKKKKKK